MTSGKIGSVRLADDRAGRLSNDELLEGLRQVPTRTGRPYVIGADLRTHSTVSKRVYVARFGSWPAAGLTIAPRGRCRQAAYRCRRPAEPVLVPAAPRRRDVTVYACTNCEQRYLAEQWCPDCQRPG